MLEDKPKKRTRSEMKGKNLLHSDDQPKEELIKKCIMEGETEKVVEDVTEPEHHKDKESKLKELKKKLKPIKESKPQTEEIKQVVMDEKPKKKNKHKSKEKKEELREQGQSEVTKKKRKSRLEEGSEEKIEQEQKAKQISEQKKKKKKHSSKKEKKKKEKQKQKVGSDNQAKEEQQSEMQIGKERKTKKSTQEGESDISASDSDEEREKQSKKKGKEEQKSIEKRGRKPKYIKRKKMSIFERQQIINKKYRIKKKSSYLNKMSDRAWGELRTGPYRQVKKVTKEDQRKIIDAIIGEGPKDKKSAGAQNQSNQDSQVKIQDNKGAREEEDEEKKEEESEQQEQVEPKKTKKKEKKKKRSASSDEEQQKPKPKKKSKSKKKKESDSEAEQPKPKPKKKKKASNTQTEIKTETAASRGGASNNGDEVQAKIEEGVEKSKNSKKKKKARKSDSSSSDSEDSDDQGKSKSNKTKKIVKKQAQNKKARVKTIKEEDTEFTKEESEKIIELFSKDGGNYPDMMKELPGIRLKKVRLHLRKLFHRALDIITYQVQHVCGRKIKQWENDERVQIVRQLHRIRSSNRLLSEANVQFRQKMTALMRSYNDESYMQTVKANDIESLYRRLEAFVRGYNTINRSKRTSAASITQSKNKEKEGRYKFSKEVTRKPIIFGGHLLSKTIKTQPKEESSIAERQEKIRNMTPTEKLVDEWNREQEKTLCQLYVSNNEADETICDRLKEKYGPSIKWRDFEVLGRKIDQLIKYALIKLQNLTARPYSQFQRKSRMERKRAKLEQNIKKSGQNYQSLKAYYKAKLQASSMFNYDNEIFQKEQRLQYKHRIFKNLPLLQRQIFGHIQSYKLKAALVRILIEEFPTEDDIQNAVRQAKNFSKWAREDERKNNISSIKSIFIGVRDDYREDNDTNQDSIMADIDKIMITKPPGETKQTGSLTYHQESQIDEKSELFGDGSRRGGEDLPIELDDEQDVLSDFQEPEQIMQEPEPEQQEYKNLERLYATLNTSKPSQK